MRGDETLPDTGTQRPRLNLSAADVAVLAMPFLPFMSSGGVARSLGYSAFVLICGAMSADAMRVRHCEMPLAAAAVVGLIVLGLATSGLTKHQALIQVGQLSAVAGVLWTANRLRPTFATAITTLTICCVFALYFVLGFFAKPTEIFSNSNMIGSAGACYFLLTLKIGAGLGDRIAARYLTCALAPSFLLVVLSQSRASLLLIAIASLYALAPRLLPRPATRALVATGLVALAATLPLIVYDPLLAQTNTEPLQSAASSAVRPLLGLSSRDIIWSTVIFEMQDTWFIGRGLGQLPGDVLRGRLAGLSAHNGFVQLLYQFGAAGLVLFSCASILVIRSLARRPVHDAGLAIFVSALVHDVFEVALMQNNFGVGLVLWLAAVMPVISRNEPHPRPATAQA